MVCDCIIGGEWFWRTSSMHRVLCIMHLITFAESYTVAQDSECSFIFWVPLACIDVTNWISYWYTISMMHTAILVMLLVYVHWTDLRATFHVSRALGVIRIVVREREGASIYGAECYLLLWYSRGLNQIESWKPVLTDDRRRIWMLIADQSYTKMSWWYILQFSVSCL